MFKSLLQYARLPLYDQPRCFECGWVKAPIILAADIEIMGRHTSDSVHAEKSSPVFVQDAIAGTA